MSRTDTTRTSNERQGPPWTAVSLGEYVVLGLIIGVFLTLLALACV